MIRSWKGTYLPKDHPDMRPPEAEARAIEYVCSIAEEAGTSVYIVHLSSKEGLESVRKARARGVDVIVETTPHYLFLNRSLLEKEDGSLFVMTPPLRTEEDNKGTFIRGNRCCCNRSLCIYQRAEAFQQ